MNSTLAFRVLISSPAGVQLLETEVAFVTELICVARAQSNLCMLNFTDRLGPHPLAALNWDGWFLSWDYWFFFFVEGKRPFGVSLLYIGWDKHYGFQLYQSDPSGNYGGWKATCIGNNSAVSIFVTLWSAGKTCNVEIAMSVRVFNTAFNNSNFMTASTWRKRLWFLVLYAGAQLMIVPKRKFSIISWNILFFFTC